MKDEIRGDKERNESVSWQAENEIGSDKALLWDRHVTQRHQICSPRMEGGIIVLVYIVIREAKCTPFLRSMERGRSWWTHTQASSTFCHIYCIPNLLWILWAIPEWIESANSVLLTQRILWGWQIWRCVGGLMTAGPGFSGSYKL